MNPYQEEQKKREAEQEELQNIYKIEMRSEHMTGFHRLGFGLCILFCVVMALVFSLVATAPMLEYDESEIYICPQHL